MKLKWLRIYRKSVIRDASHKQPGNRVCNYQDNYYGDQVCRLN